ncbi:hypothetical protein CGSHiR3021_08870 [Haemophilus influenzae 22.4-21]|uniref:Uncharacterized protein n=1 Tax=Haemophilus influenzae 22.4-21 TaxID=375063 RepID=A4NVK4_HAEIF|nr:hypothetical protein CGSHiR3021_08870 [Haemophilus influenzae 22.4-21]
MSKQPQILLNNTWNVRISDPGEEGQKAISLKRFI